MKKQTIIVLSALLLSFTTNANSAVSGGSGGGGISVGSSGPGNIESLAIVTGNVSPGDWLLGVTYDKIGLSNASDSATSVNASGGSSVDIPQGLMSAFANAGNEASFPHTSTVMARASFRDKLTVISYGTSSKAVLHAEITGSIIPGLSAYDVDYATFDLGVIVGSVTHRIDGVFTANPMAVCNPVFEDSSRDCISGTNPSYKTEIAFDLLESGGAIKIFGSLFAQATDDAVVDFTNGYKFWLEVPQGTELQSLSGLTVTQVPEPNQYVLFLMGLILIFLRRNDLAHSRTP